MEFDSCLFKQKIIELSKLFTEIKTINIKKELRTKLQKLKHLIKKKE